MPLTVPAERSPSEPRTFDAVILSSWYVTPSMLRVRLGGADLSGYATTGVPDERLRLIFEDDTLRSYTVRRFDPAGPHLDIDFVVHDGGVAAQWAVQAQPGDRIRVSEPHGWYRPPIDTEWQLLVADMTGLPALARAVEQLPRGATAHVIASVPSREDEQQVPSAATVTYEWTTDQELLAAVRSFDRPSGTGYLWAATEAADARAIRKLYHRELGWTPDRFEIKGYWRRDKETWQQRFAEVREHIDSVRDRALAEGLSGHELTQVVDAALEESGL